MPPAAVFCAALPGLGGGLPVDPAVLSPPHPTSSSSGRPASRRWWPECRRQRGWRAAANGRRGKLARAARLSCPALAAGTGAAQVLDLRHIFGRARPLARVACPRRAGWCPPPPMAAAPTAGTGLRRSWPRLAAPVPAPRPGGPGPQHSSPQHISKTELYALCARQPVEQQLRRTCGRWLCHVHRMMIG